MTYYELICNHCNKTFLRPSHYKKRKTIFCSPKCYAESRTNQVYFNCEWCNKPANRKPSETKKSKHLFCSQSCSASWNNTQRRRSRRSSCEKLLYELLIAEFPHITMLPNDKTLLDGLEIDIAIPSLKLGIEWNGIIHYRPIYGEEKLKKITERDKKKLKLAQTKEINLIVIPDLLWKSSTKLKK